jgi:2-polyprenyl-6-methoxyphenol hydroxylase-like FAD-dependent oxidoreductase
LFEIPEYANGRFSKRAKDRSPHWEWDYLPQLSEESIGTLLEEQAPWFNGGVERFSWRTLVRFEHRLAPRFGMGHIWLVGDAAHLTGPAGVQSMNMGFLEGHDLASPITRILNDAAPLQHLEEFNQSWARTWRQLLGLDAGIIAKPEADAWVRQTRTVCYRVCRVTDRKWIL